MRTIAVAAVSYGEQAWFDAAQRAHKPCLPNSLSTFVGLCHDVRGITPQDLSEPGDSSVLPCAARVTVLTRQ